jgi:hypothetical protein
LISQSKKQRMHTSSYLQSARNTLSAARGVIDGVFVCLLFADASGDARVSGTGNWHLNQTDEFIQVRSYVLFGKKTYHKGQHPLPVQRLDTGLAKFASAVHSLVVPSPPFWLVNISIE